MEKITSTYILAETISLVALGITVYLYFTHSEYNTKRIFLYLISIIIGAIVVPFAVLYPEWVPFRSLKPHPVFILGVGVKLLLGLALWVAGERTGKSKQPYLFEKQMRPLLIIVLSLWLVCICFSHSIIDVHEHLTATIVFFALNCIIALLFGIQLQGSIKKCNAFLEKASTTTDEEEKALAVAQETELRSSVYKGLGVVVTAYFLLIGGGWFYVKEFPFTIQIMTFVFITGILILNFFEGLPYFKTEEKPADDLQGAGA